MKRFILCLLTIGLVASVDASDKNKVKGNTRIRGDGNIVTYNITQQNATARGRSTVFQNTASPTAATLAARPVSIQARPATSNCNPTRPCRREDFVQWYPNVTAPRQYPCPPPQQRVQYEQPCPPGTQRTPGFTTRVYADGRREIIPGRTPGAIMAPPPGRYQQHSQQYAPRQQYQQY